MIACIFGHVQWSRWSHNVCGPDPSTQQLPHAPPALSYASLNIARCARCYGMATADPKAPHAAAIARRQRGSQLPSARKATQCCGALASPLQPHAPPRCCARVLIQRAARGVKARTTAAQVGAEGAAGEPKKIPVSMLSGFLGAVSATTRTRPQRCAAGRTGLWH